jgi:hypothetical protein
MVLNEDTFLLFAAKNYDMKRAVSTEEFYDDLKRFQYLKRLFRRYEDMDDLKIRLILNHIIILYNCFGPATTVMLFMKLEEYHKYLKPIVLYLGYMPEIIEYGEKRIISSDISLDEKIVRELRQI